MHAAHGTLPWRQLCGPAIEHAREGFAVTHHYRHFAGDVRDVLAADARSRAVFLHGTGHRHAAARRLIRQPDLARTLEEIAAGRRGNASIAAGWRGVWPPACARPAYWSMNATCTTCRPQLQDPIGIAYRGFRVTQTPPNSTGFTMLQMLKIAERFDLAALDPVQRIHVLVEAKKRAFLDRERYGTDPRFGDVPLDRLLSDAYADECAACDRHARAPAISRWRSRRRRAATRRISAWSMRRATRYPGIQSLNSGFGSGVTAGDTGILLNNRMAYWHLAPGHANRLAPGKRVRHTMNAPMVFKDGRLWAVRRHARRRQSGAGQPPGADRDDRPRRRSADRAGGAALDLEPAGAGRQLAARGRRPADHRARVRRGRVGGAGTARAPVEPRRAAGRAVQRAGDPASPRTASGWPVRIRVATDGPALSESPAFGTPPGPCLSSPTCSGQATSCWAAAWPAWCRRSPLPTGAGPARSWSRSASPGPT